MYKIKFGSREQVMNGTAKMTGGRLTKKQLKYNKYGKIVSIKASMSAKLSNNLVKSGYIIVKNKFDVIKIGGKYNNIKMGGNKCIPIIISNNLNVKRLSKEKKLVKEIKKKLDYIFNQLKNKEIFRKIVEKRIKGFNDIHIERTVPNTYFDLIEDQYKTYYESILLQEKHKDFNYLRNILTISYEEYLNKCKTLLSSIEISKIESIVKLINETVVDKLNIICVISVFGAYNMDINDVNRINGTNLKTKRNKAKQEMNKLVEKHGTRIYTKKHNKHNEYNRVTNEYLKFKNELFNKPLKKKNNLKLLGVIMQGIFNNPLFLILKHKLTNIIRLPSQFNNFRKSKNYCIENNVEDIFCNHKSQ